MRQERQQLESGIAALEAQRTALGDAVVDAAIAGLHAKLAGMMPTSAEVEPSQNLKQVCILFLDVVGSTAFAQRLDPEAISAVMDDALRRGTDIVEAHNGKVLQYAGDNFLAVFGVDEVREDDSERAVRCGLDLLSLGRALGAEVLAAHNHRGFDVRVGIHTGSVLLGGGVDADATIRGQSVNIAARMEQTAPAGALRISRDTYAQLRGLFEVELQGPVQIKGIEEPVQSYLVNRAVPRSFRRGTRGIEGVSAAMIGRADEIEVLQHAFKGLFQRRQLSAVTVVADAGVGKSRLLSEFEAWFAARPENFLAFRGRADPQTQDRPFGMLRDIFAWHFQIADDDTVAAARAKVEKGIVPLFLQEDGRDVAEGHAHLLGHLIGIEWRDSPHIQGILDDSKQIRNRAFHAAAQFFRRTSASHGCPIVLLLEDLHWADNETLDFVTYLSEIDRDVPMLILASSRPTLFDRRVSWSSDDIHRRLELNSLDRPRSRALANELLKKLPEIPTALRDFITESSEGNPFYMEELVKMLIDQKAIETGDTWKVNVESLLMTKVPSTLTGVLEARLDSLPADEKRTLQEASVIGQVFWDRTLMALDAQAEQTLPRLVKRQLVLARAQPLNDDLREHSFKHAILHQVTYATVLKRTKRELHKRVAHWLSTQTGLRATDFLGMAASHFEAAGDDANAAEFHARAAEQAITRMAHEAVMSHVQRALSLIDKTLEVDTKLLRWRLLLVREATLDLQGDRAAQLADIDAMQLLADALGDDGRLAHAAYRRSDHAMRTADWTAMEGAARKAIAWAGAAGDIELRLKAQAHLALASASLGDVNSGHTLAYEALIEARALGLRNVEGRCLNALSTFASMQGDVVTGFDFIKQSVAVYRAAGNRLYEAVALNNLGGCWMELGNLAQAQRESEEGLRWVRANGLLAMECFPLCNLSTLAMWQGEDLRGLSLARTAVESAVAVGARFWEAIALCRLGDAELALGRLDAAKQAFARARNNSVEMNSPLQHDASAGLARISLSERNFDAALRALDALLELDAIAGFESNVLEGTDGPRRIQWTCYQALVRAGDPRAADWLRRVHEAVQAMAARISDSSLRQGYLHNIPHHREILAAWAVQNGGGRQQDIAGC